MLTAKAFTSMAAGVQRVTMDTIHILLVDDDIHLAGVLKRSLERATYGVVHFESPFETLEWLRIHRPDVIILDVDLGASISGVDLCRLLRRGGWTGNQYINAAKFEDLPILMLTGQNSVGDKLTGLEAGADTFMTKQDLIIDKRNLDLRLLLLYLEKLTGRHRTPQSQTIRIPPLTIYVDTNRVYVENTPVELTAKEFGVLVQLARQPETAHSQQALLREVWGDSGNARTRAVDACVGRLRSKLATAGAADLIRSKYGEGYYLATPEPLATQG